MAATETKVEIREADEHVQPLLCKTCALKVSIHCEGCRRKANKVLQSIDGVYSVNIDLRQQKVVVTGNVDGQTLIKKLIKAGFKHAELWPEKAKSKKKKQAKRENKEKQKDIETSEESGCENEKETVKVTVQDAEGGGNPGKNSEVVNVVRVVEGPTGVVQIREPKQEVKQTVILPATTGNQPPEKKVSIAVPVGGEIESGSKERSGGGGGGGGKKKKKKGHKANNAGGNDVQVQYSGDAPACTGSANQGQGPVPVPSTASQSPPRHHMYHQYPAHYYAPPVYTVSHHTAYPSGNYSASYYAAPQPSSCAYYGHPGGMEGEAEAPPYDHEVYTSQPSDSFEFFSDENPNGCSVM